MATDTGIILGLTVALPNTTYLSQLGIYSHLIHRNTKTKMVMAGVTTLLIQSMVMHVSGIGVHRGETEKGASILTLMALQTHPPLEDMNGM